MDTNELLYQIEKASGHSRAPYGYQQGKVVWWEMSRYKWASPIAQLVKNPPAMQETEDMWVQSLGQEDPLENEMATHSSIFTWKILWTEEPGGLQSMGS